MSLFEVDPRRVLLPAHQYFAEISELRCYDLGREFTLLSEKADYLQLPIGALAKTVYWELPIGEHHRLYAAVVPADCRIDIAPLLADAGVTRMSLAKRLPYGMARGSCGPFICHDDCIEGLVHGDVKQPVVRAIFHDVYSLDAVMEFAVPGKPQFSLQVPMGSIIDFFDRHHAGLLRQACLRLPSESSVHASR